MAEDVGNLAVRLSLDSANFTQSMASIDRSLKALGQEMRANQNHGKDWGNSITGLTTKQEGLTRMLDAQDIKVRRLREAYEASKAATGENSIATENLAIQLNRATAEYNRTESELNQVREALRRQQDELRLSESAWTQLGERLTAVGSSMQKVGDKMKDVGKDLSMKVTAPIVAVGAASAKLAIDFEAQMSRVGAIAGATGGEMDALKASAMELGADTSKSAGEVAVAMEDMAAMGFTAVEIIGAMPGVISASEASGESLALSAQTVAAALNIWGLEATEAGRVADVLAMAANASAAGIGDMQMAFKYAGAPAAALGIEMEDVAAAIGIMTNAGLDGSGAGTALRASLLALNNPAKAQAKMMEKLGISMRDENNEAISLAAMVGVLAEQTEHMSEADRVATLAKLVGTEAVSGFLALIKAGPVEINKMSDALRDSAGASAETAAVMKDNLKGSLEELGGTLETAAIQIGNILIPIIREVTITIQELVEKFTELSPATQKTILVIAGIAAAIGPILVVVGTLVSSIGSIISAFGAMSGAIAAAGGAVAILTGPIGIAIAAIAAVIAVGTAWYKNFEKIESIIGTTGATILGLTNPLTQAATIIKLVKRGFEDAIPEVDRFGEGVSETTQEALGSFFELSDGVAQSMAQLSITSSRVTAEMKEDIVGKYAEMNAQVLEGKATRHAEELAQMENMFLNTSALTDKEKEEILAKKQAGYDKEVEYLQYKEVKINEILQLAADENRALTEREKEVINNINRQAQEEAVIVLSESQMEQKIIFEKMKDSASELSAIQAAEVVKNATEQKNISVAEAEAQYDKTYAAILRMRDETGELTTQQADKLIAEAKKSRDETVKYAESMHSDIVEEAKLQAGEHVKEVDWETGEILSKWAVFKDKMKVAFDETNKAIAEKWNEAKDTTISKTKEMADAARSKFGDMTKSVVVKMIEIKTNIEKKWNEAQSFLTNIDLKQIGTDIIQGLIKGIKDKIADVSKAVTEVTDAITGKIKDILQIKSPSRVMMQIGKWISEGLGVGIESEKSNLATIMSDIGHLLIDITEHYASEEKKVITNKNAEIAKIEKRSKEDIDKIYRAATASKRKTTQDENIKIQRIQEDAAKKIAELEKKAANDSYKLLVESDKKMLEEIKLFIQDKKSLEQLSLVEEANVWEESLKLFNDGTKEKVEAQKNYRDAVEVVNKEITAINKEHEGEMKQINDDLIKQTDDLNKAYEDAYNKRVSSLLSFAGTFDEYKVEIKKSGDELLANLQSQVDGIKLWQDEFAKLSNRGIDADLLNELSGLGVKALPELIALNSLTDEQLTLYSTLYQEKTALAREQAEAELIGMKEDTQMQIEALREVANNQLDALQVEWTMAIQSLTQTTSTELSTLKQIGVNAGQGLLNGLASMEAPLIAKAQQIANAISAAMASALQVKSPSRVTMKIGGFVGEGLVIGMEDKLRNVVSAGKKLAQAAAYPVEGNQGVNASGRGDYSSNDNSRSYTGNTTIIVQNPNLSPSEIAKKSKQAQRQMALEWGV